MKSQLLLAFLLFVLAGILGVDRRPAEAAAALITAWAHDERREREPWSDRHFRVSYDDIGRIEWRDARSRSEYLPLHGVGTFRCRSRSGLLAPYDIVVPLETVDGRLRRVQAQETTARSRRLSCGLHVMPGQQQAEEFFAESGSAALYAGVPAVLASAPTLTLELYRAPQRNAFGE